MLDSEPGQRAVMLPGAATHDPATRCLSVAPRWGGGERQIHVYEIDTPVVQPPPTDPPLPAPKFTIACVPTPYRTEWPRTAKPQQD